EGPVFLRILLRLRLLERSPIPVRQARKRGTAGDRRATAIGSTCPVPVALVSVSLRTGLALALALGVGLTLALAFALAFAFAFALAFTLALSFALAILCHGSFRADAGLSQRQGGLCLGQSLSGGLRTLLGRTILTARSLCAALGSRAL